MIKENVDILYIDSGVVRKFIMRWKCFYIWVCIVVFGYYWLVIVYYDKIWIGFKRCNGLFKL